MGEPSLTSVLDCLHRVVGPAAQREVSDGELLERFARTRDEAAFELLVWRHGPMVLALCRRLLGQEQDAEDALQATFLVLVRKAGSIKKKQSLASWLYKVAHRIANRARLHAARLRAPVPTSDAAVSQTRGAVDTETDAIWRELREKLDGEIAQLPEKYRRPLILCYLEGKTHEEAARLLGCPKGTLASQVARARDRLHARLTRRGWEFPSGVMTALLAERASAGPIAAGLVHATVRSALAFASGQAAAITSAKAVGMAEGALRLMWYGKMKIIGGVLLAVVIGATGIGLATRDLWAAGETDNAQIEPEPPRAPVAPGASTQGDPKKEIAVLRQEIAELRGALAMALDEIKGLKNALRQAGTLREEEPLYRGKPARFWIEQFKDADEGFREAAVQALAALGPKNKNITPVLITALRDPAAGVRDQAVRALAMLSPDVEDLNKVRGILSHDPSPQIRATAADLLGRIGGERNIAALTAALDDSDPGVVNRAARYLTYAGSKAKSAIPALVDAFAKSLQSLRVDTEANRVAFDRTAVNPSYILNALLVIEPELKQTPEVAKIVLAVTHPAMGRPPGPGPIGWRDSIAGEQLPLWRQAADALKKKYGRP